jgi:hypothetical protein
VGIAVVSTLIETLMGRHLDIFDLAAFVSMLKLALSEELASWRTRRTTSGVLRDMDTD